jgi:hypothetical protein
MTARDGEDITSARSPLDAGTMVAISPLPPPEEVFIDWLMSVPPDDCLEAAARYQIEIIDRSAVLLHPSVRHLRTLLVAVSGDADWPRPISNL